LSFAAAIRSPSDATGVVIPVSVKIFAESEKSNQPISPEMEEGSNKAVTDNFGENGEENGA